VAERLVQAIDAAGQNAWRSLADTWGKFLTRRPATVTQPTLTPASTNNPRETLERLQRIWQLLQETPGFDSMKLLQLAARVLVKPETQQLGQQIAGELAQRAIARLIREVLMARSPQSAAESPPALPIAAWR